MILSLNLTVPVDEMSTVDPVGRLTFEINDNEMCVKNCELDAMWSVAPLAKIHGFVKAELEEELWASRLLGTEALYDVSIGLVTGAFFARHYFFYLGDKKWRGCQGTKIGALIHIRKWKKNGKKKRCFLFFYVYITSFHV